MPQLQTNPLICVELYASEALMLVTSADVARSVPVE